MPAGWVWRHTRGMDKTAAPLPPKNTSAFFVQSGIAFAIALTTMIVAIFYLPVDPWIRAFLGLGTMFLTTSAFTLAKVIRDQQETQHVVTRLDQARLERLMAEYDPWNKNTT